MVAPERPGFFGKRKNLEMRRRSRQDTRTAQGKNPLAQPLLIAPPEQIKEALSRGKMVFFDGQQKIEVELNKKRDGKTEQLQGIYKLGPQKYVVVRSSPQMGFPSLVVFELVLGKIFQREKKAGAFFMVPELGHMLLKKQFRGHSIGLKTASKVERSVRAQTLGKHTFLADKIFVGLFKKLGYREEPRSNMQNNMSDLRRLSKKGKFTPKDNLLSFHRIEAVDPKTGRVRIFSFPIQSK